LSHFLRAGASPDDVTDIGQPPLCIAIANGYVEIAKILLDAGANINATTKDGGETALHIAVKNGRVDLMELILAYGPNLEVKTQGTGETALHYAAAKSGSLAVVMTLLKHGASYNALNSSVQTPAEAALKANNINGAVAIINAANGKRNELVKEKELLLKHVQKTQGRFSIGNDLIADIFVAACDPESNVLVEAIRRNDVLLVEMFLEKGSDPDRQTARGQRPIFVALACADVAVIEAILKRNPDLSVRDEKGLNVLQAAFECPLAKEKDAFEVIFKALLEEGADAKVMYPDGKTLLHRAVSQPFGNVKVSQLLVEAGVQVTTQDSEGNTALHYAIHSRSCLDLLLKNKANPHQPNANGLAPLLFATTHCKKENEPILESLIRVSDLRKTNAQGHTALHLAAINGLEKTARFLLRARADPTVVDKNKNSPLLLAVKHHQWSVVPVFTTTPSVNAWDVNGYSALHHVVRSSPKSPATWNDVAAATASFCERGVSRSIRDRSGATPLILAVKTLPEEGLPVIEALLVQRAGAKARWNFVNHEDHTKRDALFYAATMGKATFVDALLKNGATFKFEEWIPSTHRLQSSKEANKQILKSFAEHEWVRRTNLLREQPRIPDDHVSAFTTLFPVRDIELMISMGLEVNNLPNSTLGKSLLWAILRHIPMIPPLAPEYLIQVLKVVLNAGADPNASSSRHAKRSSWPCPQQGFTETPRFTIHPLTFLLEECPRIDIEVIRLLLAREAKPSLASGFYKGRFPLHCAVKARRVDAIEELLLEQGDMNCVDDIGRTPIYLAAESGDWEMIDVLIGRGAELDVADSEKNTPLHVAAMGGSEKVIASLVRAGAKVDVKNTKDLTPLGCLRDGLEEKEKREIEGMLRGSEATTKRAREVEMKKAQTKTNTFDAEVRKDSSERNVVPIQANEKATREATREQERIKMQLQKEQEEKEKLLKEEKEAQDKVQDLPIIAKEVQVKPQPQIGFQALSKDKVEPAVTVEPTSPTLRKHRSISLFRKSSFFFNKNKSAIFSSDSDPTSKPKHSTLLSMRINAPFRRGSTTNLTNLSSNPPSPSTPNILQSPDFFKKDFSASPAAPQRPRVPVSSAAIQNRLSAPRVDSSLSQRMSKGKSEILDLDLVNEKLNRSSFNTEEDRADSEFSDWLKVSNMLDNL